MHNDDNEPLDQEVVEKTILDVDELADQADRKRDVDEDEDLKQLREALRRMSKITV